MNCTGRYIFTTEWQAPTFTPKQTKYDGCEVVFGTMRECIGPYVVVGKTLYHLVGYCF